MRRDSPPPSQSHSLRLFARPNLDAARRAWSDPVIKRAILASLPRKALRRVQTLSRADAGVVVEELYKNVQLKDISRTLGRITDIVSLPIQI